MSETLASKKWILAIVLAMVIFAGFSPLFVNDSLVWDDDLNIVKNTRLCSPTLENTAFFWKKPYLRMYIPVTYTVWSGISYISDATGLAAKKYPVNARIFHVTNLLVHTLNAILVFLLFGILVKNRAAACFGALVFAIHPLQAEPVSYVTELKTLLSFLFSILAMHQYFAFCQKRDQHGRAGEIYILSLILFALALLSKPICVVAPVFVLIINHFFLDVKIIRNLRDMSLWFLLAALAMLITIKAQPPYTYQYIPELWQRIFVASDSTAFYLYKLIFPKSMIIDYGRTPQMVLESYQAYFTWIFPATCLGLLLFFRTRMRLYLACFLLFCAGFVPVSGLAPFVFQSISTVADRYMYFSMLGPALSVAVLIKNADRLSYKKIAAACICLLTLATYAQARTWDNHKTLYVHTLNINPSSVMALNNYASEYFHNTLDGIKLYYRALGIKPGYNSAAGNLCDSVLFVRAHYPNTDLGFLINKSAQHEKKKSFYMGLSLVRSGEFHKAKSFLGKALYINVFDQKVLNNLGAVMVQTGDDKNARAVLLLAVSQNADDSYALNNIGAALFHLDEGVSAVNCFNRALEISGNDPDISKNLSLALLKIDKNVSIKKQVEFYLKYQF